MRCPLSLGLSLFPKKLKKEKVWLSVMVVDLYFQKSLWGWSSMYILTESPIKKFPVVGLIELGCNTYPHEMTWNHINLSQAVHQVLGSWVCEWKCLCSSFHCREKEKWKRKKKGKSQLTCFWFSKRISCSWSIILNVLLFLLFYPINSHTTMHRITMPNSELQIWRERCLTSNLPMDCGHILWLPHCSL